MLQGLGEIVVLEIAFLIVCSMKVFPTFSSIQGVL